MNYNHNAENLDEAIGQPVDEVIKKVSKILSKTPPEYWDVLSRQVELLEKNFTAKELAILLTVGEIKKDPKVKIVEMNGKDIPEEIIEALTEQFKKGDLPELGVIKIKKNPDSTDLKEECNCVACQLERKIKKIQTMPLSKGGRA